MQSTYESNGGIAFNAIQLGHLQPDIQFNLMGSSGDIIDTPLDLEKQQATFSGSVTATSFYGSGSGLRSLPATQIKSALGITTLSGSNTGDVTLSSLPALTLTGQQLSATSGYYFPSTSDQSNWNGKISGNQTINLGGILSGSGTTSINASAASGYYMPITTDQSNWNGKQAALGFTPANSTTTVNGHALSSNVVVSASDITTGTLPAAQLPTATTSAQGAVQPDGTTITINAGVISAASSGGSSGQSLLPQVTGYLPKALNVESIPSGNTLIYTVPAGKRAIFFEYDISTYACSGTLSYYFYSVTSGSVTRNFQAAQSASASSNNYSTLPPVILDPGDSLYISTSVANAFLSFAFALFDSTNNYHTVWSQIDSSKNWNLYQCPSGKTALFFASTSYAPSSLGSAVAFVYNTSAVSPTITYWLVKSGSSPSNANKVSSFSVGANGARGNPTFAGGLAAGDSIYGTSSASNSGQNFFITVFEQ